VRDVSEGADVRWALALLRIARPTVFVALIAAQWGLSVGVAIVSVDNGRGLAVAVGWTILISLAFAVAELGSLYMCEWLRRVLATRR
jgi:hypothetical protein